MLGNFLYVESKNVLVFYLHRILLRMKKYSSMNSGCAGISYSGIDSLDDSLRIQSSYDKLEK